MADYDVGVIELTTPAATAPLAQTRPVVSVRNNGVHDAVASGYLRIYSAGLLVFQTECFSDTIGPGETRPCSAVDYWTPEAEGTYIVQGYFDTPLDQVEPNNNLYPTTIIISGLIPPPPTPVPAHASQHESGGADEMSLEDLPGRTADQQHPTTHASDHELGGTDPVNVTDMPGILAESQKPKAHATSHKVGGSDLLDVLALPNATDLELVARKGANNGYAPLDTDATVPTANLAIARQSPPSPSQALLYSHDWGYPIPAPHASSHEAGNDDEIDVTDLPGQLADVQKAETLNSTGAYVNIDWDSPETIVASLTAPATWMNSSLGVILNLAGRLTAAVAPGAVLRIKVKQGAAILCQHDVDVNKNSVAPASIHGFIAAIDALNLKAFLEFMADSDAVQHLGTHVSTCVASTGYTADATTFSITVQFINAVVAHNLMVDISHSWNTGQLS